MGSEWKECELGDVLELKRGYDLPKTKREDGVVPVISSSGESGEHNEYKVSAPGVVTGRYGTIGQVFYVEDNFWPLNTTLYVRDFKGNDPLFIYYFLKTIPYKDYTDKAAVPGINRNHLHKAKVRVPVCPKYQNRLASQLRAFDKKISLNNQINQTLEQMAQTLFKSWFVDFDPVIDNALDAGSYIPEVFEARVERRKAVRESADFKPLPDDVRQLFPSEFEESGLGWVPKGWSVTSVSEISDILNGFAFKSKDYVTSGNFVLRTKNFSENQVKKAHDDVFLPDKFLDSHSKYLCKPLDYHLVMVGASVGKCALIFEHHLPALRNQNMWCFRAKDKSIASQSFIKHMLDNLVLKNQGLASGSAREFFRKGDFGNQQVVIGSSDIQRQFEMNVLPTIEKMSLIASEVDVLTKLRDTLLPKLISGELRLDSPEVEQAKALVD
ncbi:type I restriction-modification system subunit S [Vibrio hyugaensis]|uniref:Type I restriction-modification system subunit S n=1 Tax=Vibrio hyugaensis TaxID=1534743 RepID=A0ABQ5YDT7_9VIBR|nr:restriction endonuclease subunit S [Vibrio hyugaensis]GLR07200.1 type I restriction-modification system subunit S [Vibrio hyugaensis]